MNTAASIEKNVEVTKSQGNVRLLIVGAAAIWTLITIGIGFQQSWATWLWPWQDAGMTYVFLASLVAAVAAPLAWIALVNEPGAVAGTALDAAAIGIGTAVAMLVLGIARGNTTLLIAAAVASAFTASSWYIFRATHLLPIRNLQPMPRMIRVAYYTFIALLIPVGAMLVLRVDGIFPWNLLPATSTIVGVMFMGAAAYFVYALKRDTWVHAGGQLAGFLAYDIVLLVPYLRMLRNWGDEATTSLYAAPGMANGTGSEVNERSLAVFLIVITISSAVAIYYLFIDRRTTIWHPVHTRAS